MNTDIHSDSGRTRQDDDSVGVSSEYPVPTDLSIEHLIVNALLKNIPIFLIAICLIFLVA